jgi:hypothetical protein
VQVSFEKTRHTFLYDDRKEEDTGHKGQMRSLIRFKEIMLSRGPGKSKCSIISTASVVIVVLVVLFLSLS